MRTIVYIRIVAMLGLLSMLMGIGGHATFLTCGCLLLGFALVATAIDGRQEK
jgi:hypothetical protein